MYSSLTGSCPAYNAGSNYLGSALGLTAKAPFAFYSYPIAGAVCALECKCACLGIKMQEFEYSLRCAGIEQRKAGTRQDQDAHRLGIAGDG
jgi:hypothetical protein